MYFERSGSACSARRARRIALVMALPAGRSGCPTGTAGASSPSATRKRTDMPGSASVAARRTSSEKCPSIQERVNSLGTPTSSTSPSSASARVVENQAPKTIGERSSRMRSATAVQRRSGVWGSTGMATRVHGASGGRSRRTDGARGADASASDATRPLAAAAKSRSLRTLLKYPHRHPQTARMAQGPQPHRPSGIAQCPRHHARVVVHTAPCARPATRPTATLPLSRPADPTSPREAHLPAQ